MIVSNVKAIMEAKGVGVQQLAKRTGLAVDTINRVTRGGGPYEMGSCTLLTLESIAKALGVSVKDLFFEI